jgi:DNA-binding MarR family transcriptional regulator
MLDSTALRLSQGLESFRGKQVQWLLHGLAARGFADLNPTYVSFLGVLDCADNFAAEIARRLNVTRQAVHKTVKELETLGYVSTAPNETMRNSRVIRITEHGEALIAEARMMFAKLDELVLAQLSPQTITEMETLFAVELPDVT